MLDEDFKMTACCFVHHMRYTGYCMQRRKNADILRPSLLSVVVELASILNSQRDPMQAKPW
jgi:hypothetical protein